MIGNDLGLEFTAANEQAVQAFEATVSAYAGFRRDIGQRLKDTFAADPDMPMAHVLKGLFFQFMALPALVPRAHGALAAACAVAAKCGANERERLHIDGLEAWIRGDFHAAIHIYEAILSAHPLDLLALKLANFFYFYVGDSRNVRDGVARVFPHWQPHYPGYGFVLSLYAFGLEENGQYAQAEHLGRQAIELNPADGWAVHAVAHVTEMTDRHQDGIAWIAGLEPHWSALNNFRFHLWWHRALLHLNRGEKQEALRLYDEQILDPESDDYLDLSNDISLLQRLEFAGVDVGERWQLLADKAEKLCTVRYFAFIDAHYLLALAAAGRHEQARTMLDRLREYAQASAETTAQVTARVNGALCEALLAYRQNDCARTVERLAPLRDEIYAIGGSHAQRDLFDEILVDAALRAGCNASARTVLSERTVLRPGNAWNWPRLAHALEALGDIDGAAQARRRAAA